MEIVNVDLQKFSSSGSSSNTSSSNIIINKIIDYLFNYENEFIILFENKFIYDLYLKNIII